MSFKIRDKIDGVFFKTCKTLEDAKAAVEMFEAEDKANGSYTEDFYEIVEEAFDWREYQLSYAKQNYKQIKFSLSYTKDGDVIRHLESVNNIKQYITALIRADMNK